MSKWTGCPIIACKNDLCDKECQVLARSRDEAPITREEMINLFGEAMPMAAIALLWESPDDRTIGQIRAQLRAIASHGGANSP